MRAKAFVGGIRLARQAGYPIAHVKVVPTAMLGLIQSAPQYRFVNRQSQRPVPRPARTQNQPRDHSGTAVRNFWFVQTWGCHLLPLPPYLCVDSGMARQTALTHTGT
jgi:hypothetical protein